MPSFARTNGCCSSGCPARSCCSGCWCGCVVGIEMSWKNTWILVGLAGALFAFIVLVERRFIDVTGTVAEPKPLFASFKPTAATAIQIRRGSQYVINLERTNGGWAFAKKFSYPAAAFPVQSFLEQLERAVPATRISAREILSHKQTSA